MKAFDGISFGRGDLAVYACFAAESRGRLFDEAVSPTRTCFQRDRDRIIHSTAFRRLKHKTQVFVPHVGDHYRTRLTHSIEVSQIARSLARAFAVDEDLAECLALCHDFGHTPFGHAGEDTLDALMQEWGGFDHNAQSLKIVTELEQQYAGFDGLNLSWETLEGLVKHNGPVTGSSVPGSIVEFNKLFDLELESFASVEAQCAAIADDIAYNAHDIDDGLRAKLFTVEDIAHLPVVSQAHEEITKRFPNLDRRRVRHEIVRRQITEMVEDVITNGMANLEAIAPQSATAVRHCGKTLIGFSSEMAAKEQVIKDFLYKKMYRSERVMDMRLKAEKIITNLFNAYFSNPKTHPPGLRRHMTVKTEKQGPRVIADYIASMTDSFAISEHRRLFDDTPYFS